MKAKIAEIECVVDCQNTLGEGPVWSSEEQKLYWVDIQKSEVWCYDPETGDTKVWNAPERVVCLAPREGGGFLVAFESGLAFYDLETGKVTKIRNIEADLPSTRMNDGRCDRQGRFVIGGMDESEKADKISNVYRLDKDLSIRKIISGVACANSICFSPDGRVMYFADTPVGEICAYDYDPDAGNLSNKRIFADFADQPGTPDGSIVDAEGGVWNAQWNGHRVVRYRPDGTMDRVFDFPVLNPTCVVFGGKDLDVLYVTTARYLMTPEQIEDEPLSGGVFAMKIGVKGLDEPKFCG
ncbi:MAG: SMP-30/gluconolactonase/LRE family protein [Syntrophobacterales bacterium]|nr:MAG: SMP-30/gluconolactonase/LRE family protein [Syntrophobacterales bacterium]